jgi:hypothetical protein
MVKMISPAARFPVAACLLLMALALPRAGAEESAPRNLLNPEDAEIIAAPSDRPAKLLEGGFDLPADELAGAVYAFKRPSEISVVRIFIESSNPQNIKSLELLSADSPNGPFVPVASAGETINLKLFKTGGWQEFSVDPVRLTHFQIRAVTHGHLWVRVGREGQNNGLQFMGRAEGDSADSAEAAPAASAPAADTAAEAAPADDAASVRP